MNPETTVRDRIVEAAHSLFSAQGIQAVGMDAVRDASGVPLKRLYAQFPSKEALIVAVLGYMTNVWDAGVSSAAAKVTSPRDKLLAIYDYLEDWFIADDFRGCGFINAFGELGPSSPAVAKAARKQKATFQAYVANLVDELGAPPVLAEQLTLLAEGAQTTAAISGTPHAAGAARTAAETLIEASIHPKE